MINILNRIFFFTIISSLMVFANSTDEMIIEFEENRVSNNENIELHNVSINTKKSLPIKGWYGYILDIEAKLNGKDLKVKDILFTDGRYVTMDLIDSKSGQSLKQYVKPNLTYNYYDKSKLIAGTHNAKDKIVVFSDPLCPFCMQLIPEIIKHVQKNSEKIALYYYHFPLLQIHPASGVLSKIMDVARHKQIKNIELKVYTTNWEKYFSIDTTDEKVILDTFNRLFKTNILLSEIAPKSLDQLILNDMKMGENVMVQGTPTVFINGVNDSTKVDYKKLGM